MFILLAFLHEHPLKEKGFVKRSFVVFQDADFSLKRNTYSNLKKGCTKRWQHKRG